MEYSLKLSAIPNQSSNEIIQKSKLVQNLLQNFNLLKNSTIEFPKIDMKISKPRWHASLNRILKSGYKGHLSFQNRGDLGGVAMYDDRVTLYFNPLRIDYEFILNQVFPESIKVFSPYRACIVDLDLGIKDVRVIGIKDIRKEIDRIQIVDYIDEAYCKVYFDKNSDDIIRILSNQVHEVRKFHNGVIVTLFDKPMKQDELEELSNLTLAKLKKKY